LPMPSDEESVPPSVTDEEEEGEGELGGFKSTNVMYGESLLLLLLLSPLLALASRPPFPPQRGVPVNYYSPYVTGEEGILYI